jgi:hypothetical protein
MNIKLVFEDWLGNDHKSIYNTQKGVELSAGDLHHGSTFNASIQLDEDSTLDMVDALRHGFNAVFYVVPEVEDGILLDTPLPIQKPTRTTADRSAIPFDIHDTHVLLECANRLLADGELFDEMAEKLDLSDSAMQDIRDRAQAYMNTESA